MNWLFFTYLSSVVIIINENGTMIIAKKCCRSTLQCWM